MENMNKSTLLPCPFCGGQAVVLKRVVTFYPKCFKCKAMLDILYFTEQDAIDGWNKRFHEKDKDKIDVLCYAYMANDANLCTDAAEEFIKERQNL